MKEFDPASLDEALEKRVCKSHREPCTIRKLPLRHERRTIALIGHLVDRLEELELGIGIIHLCNYL
jgi:hypothetical protein